MYILHLALIKKRTSCRQDRARIYRAAWSRSREEDREESLSRWVCKYFHAICTSTATITLFCRLHKWVYIYANTCTSKSRIIINPFVLNLREYVGVFIPDYTSRFKHRFAQLSSMPKRECVGRLSPNTGTQVTRNAWQSLAYSPLGAAVSPPSR